MRQVKKFNWFSIKTLILSGFLTSILVGLIAQPAFSGNLWKTLPVQHQGRVKPFDTLAREVLLTVYGRETFKPKEDIFPLKSEEKSSFWQSRSQRKDAVDVVLSWMLIPVFWDTVPFILVESGQVKEVLSLPLKRRHFSPVELAKSQKLVLQLTELQALRQRKEPLDSYFKSLEKLETRLILYSVVKSGALLKIEPQEGTENWRSLSELSPPVTEKLEKAIQTYIQWIAALSSPSKTSENNVKKEKSTEAVIATGADPAIQIEKEQFIGERKQALNKALLILQDEIFQNFPNSFSSKKIRAEVFLNSFKPFRLAWILYLLFLMSCVFFSFTQKGQWVPWLFYIPGLVSHISGLVLRSYIMSRPPVTNMYETVVWVPFVALVVGLVFYWKKSFIPFIASVILAFFCLFLTDMAPQTLDGSLQPLEAVLRSNFWLSTHVLIITMSYAFFCLAFILGDIALLQLLFKRTQGIAEEASPPIYRTLQWGVVLLAGGTILGAIWADYSWGRFWGWDPKESWALISLLGYLALLHGRFAGWIRPLSFVTGSVLMFFLILMAWYGVNFILGAGLHSYGFGTGGVEYVAGFFCLHVLLCAAVLIQHKKTSYTLSQ